jgi:hypothetical protein
VKWRSQYDPIVPLQRILVVAVNNAFDEPANDFAQHFNATDAVA